MTIKAIEVERDFQGYWTHPELPDWGEHITQSELDAWKAENSIDVVFVWMESDADEDVLQSYFEDGDPFIGNWEPVPPEANAFVLSIHDTEDGPVAVFAVPKEAETPA